MSITLLIDPEQSPIVKVLTDMWNLLVDWSARSDSPWFLLPMCGVVDFDKEALRKAARRQATIGCGRAGGGSHLSPTRVALGAECLVEAMFALPGCL